MRLAAERAADLISRYAGGTVLEGTVEENHLDIKENVIRLSVDKVTKVLGMSISKEEMVNIFERLGFAVEDAERELVVTVPSEEAILRLKKI